MAFLMHPVPPHKLYFPQGLIVRPGASSLPALRRHFNALHASYGHITSVILPPGKHALADAVAELAEMPPALASSLHITSLKPSQDLKRAKDIQQEGSLARSIRIALETQTLAQSTRKRVGGLWWR
jgi:hypothetical protein